MHISLNIFVLNSSVFQYLVYFPLTFQRSFYFQSSCTSFVFHMLPKFCDNNF
ncbi:unnamed protein product [Meloidogyne enterolobii]|uniref:Uncharacterized protein n=1 Tax=Meloidogyne enterolobii TaxID=390850 RepID=A0ACB0XWE4_MELEN